MKTTLTLAAILAALCALPAVAADDSGPDVTVVVSGPVQCESARIGDDDLLGPAFSSRAGFVVEDCDATLTYEGHNYRARCAPRSTNDVVFYEGPDVSIDSYCGVTVEI